MNQHKRKASNAYGSAHAPQIKKLKLDTNNVDKFKHKIKKKRSKLVNSQTTNKGVAKQDMATSVTGDILQSGKTQNGDKKKKRQWQSIKEKRKRMKKKYLLSDKTKDAGSATSEDKVTQPNLNKSGDSNTKNILKIPEKSSEYSSNWKNLMKTLNISSSRKKKKRKTEEVKSSSAIKKEVNKEPEIWFDDVDDILLDKKLSTDQADKLVKQESYTGLTKDVAMDCEMVGVGWDGKDNQLARVSIVNHFGNCILDKFVKPKETVTDYRTKVSGIRPEDLEKGEDFESVQKEVAEILNGRLLIGHAIYNDLKVLYLSHPKKKIRDTSRYKPFRQLFDGRNPSLKKLTAKVLGVSVQEGEHNSIQDAQAAMRLYTMHKKQWEKDLKYKNRHIPKGPKKKQKEK